MKLLLSVAGYIMACVGIACPANASVVKFNNSPFPPKGYSPLGVSFQSGGFTFAASKTLERQAYKCNLLSGCKEAGIAFPFLVDIRRTDGNPFSFQGIYLSGGLNYDGAAPEYTKGFVIIEYNNPTGTHEFKKYLSEAGFIDVNLGNVKSMSLAYDPDASSTNPIFDNLTYSLDTAPPPPPQGVPEPANWATMIVGLAMVGSTMRKRAGVRAEVY